MMTLLLVDDEPMTLRVMRQALEKDGFAVQTAFDGVDALEKLSAQTPDVLITDIDMPRMSGKELVLHLVEADPDRKYPIFITTSLTALEHRDWSQAVDNLIFVEKPISLRKLRTDLQRLVAANETSASEAAE